MPAQIDLGIKNKRSEGNQGGGARYAPYREDHISQPNTNNNMSSSSLPTSSLSGSSASSASPSLSSNASNGYSSPSLSSSALASRTVGFGSDPHNLYQDEDVSVQTSNAHLLWSNIFALLTSVALLATGIIFLVSHDFDKVLDIAGLTPLFITIVAGFLIFNSILGLVLWHQSANSSSNSNNDKTRYSQQKNNQKSKRRGQNPYQSLPAGSDSDEYDYDDYGGQNKKNSNNSNQQSNSSNKDNTDDSNSEELVDSARVTNICAFPVTVHYVLNIIGMILCLALMIAAVASWGKYRMGTEGFEPLVHHERVFRWAFCVVLLLNAIALCIGIYGDLSISWGERKGVAWAFIVTVCIFLLATGTALAVINTFDRANRVKWIFLGFQATGALLIIAATFGIASACVTPGANLDIMIVTYELFLFVAFVCSVFFALFGLFLHEKMTAQLEVILAINIILMFLTMVLFLTSKKVSQVMGQRTLPSGLSIQILDIRALSDDHKARWAAAIDRGNGLRHLGAWDGAGAIEMMKAYSRRGVPDIGGLCLHLYTPMDGRPASINHTPTAHAPRDETVALIFITVVEIIDLTRFVKPLSWLCGRNSLFKSLVVRFGIVGFHWPFTSGVFLVKNNPNSVRRNNAQILSNSLRGAIEYNNSLPSEHRWSLFLLPAMDTEPVAHVLEPTKSGFSYATLPYTAIVDLRAHRGKTWQEYIRTGLRYGNRREYDKPFYDAGGTIHYIRDVYDDSRQTLLNPQEADVFYKNKNPYSNPANAGKTGLIDSYGYSNESSDLRSSNDVVLSVTTNAQDKPTVVNSKSRRGKKVSHDEETKISEEEERALSALIDAASEGANVSTVTKDTQAKPASTWKSNQSWEVEEASEDIGAVPEKFESSYPGWTNDFYALWSHIAQLRIAQGHEPTLYDLTPQMFADVAKMSPQNRYLMLLRLDGQPIGSSVIFRFPRSRMMTCDMQGLEHSQGRKVRAYFLMLSRSIRLALEQGFDYVDFGPTALGPKTDAGATLYPCRLGLYATDPALRIIVRLCVSAFANNQSKSEDEATAHAPRVVIHAPPDMDAIDTNAEVPAFAEVLIQNTRSTAEEDARKQSQETLEELLRMNPESFTGSQRKRFQKFTMKIRRKYKGQYSITEKSSASEVGAALIAAIESGDLDIAKLEGDEGGAPAPAAAPTAASAKEDKKPKGEKKAKGAAESKDADGSDKVNVKGKNKDAKNAPEDQRKQKNKQTTEEVKADVDRVFEVAENDLAVKPDSQPDSGFDGIAAAIANPESDAPDLSLDI